LSIGYRTRKASKTAEGRRLLTELELWEVSLVTFPMLETARVAAKAEAGDLSRLAQIFAEAQQQIRSESSS
jgi:phage head maturation protease